MRWRSERRSGPLSVNGLVLSIRRGIGSGVDTSCNADWVARGVAGIQKGGRRYVWKRSITPALSLASGSVFSSQKEPSIKPQQRHMLRHALRSALPRPSMSLTPEFKSELRHKAAEANRRYAMAAPVAPTVTDEAQMTEEDIASFQKHLASSKRVLALCGAGLSAASGLPTFRGAGGLWRNNDATSLATPEAFEASPGLVWQFYGYRRHMALQAKPNPAHYALAELSGRKDFLTITQNVDGLSQRADHPRESLELLHGSLFDVKCTGFDCDYLDKDNFKDPLVPALEIPKDPKDPSKDLDISQVASPLRQVSPEELPRCPKCYEGFLRPGVVWFGEALPMDTIDRVDKWIEQPEGIDLLLVIGTSAVVYPAAGYIQTARMKGAKVAVINMERPDEGRQVASKLRKGDWFFCGDAGVILPEILGSKHGGNS